jgi:hypothetical protein
VDRFRPGGLAGVDGHGEPVSAGERECLGVRPDRVSGFGAGEVEAAHPAVPHGHGELGQLDRRRGREVPEGAHDDPGADVEAVSRTLQAREDGREHVLRCQATLRVQERTEANLGVPHVLDRLVLGELVGESVEGRRILHDRDRDLEGREIIFQAARVVRDEAALELLGVGGREGNATLGGELDHGRGPERSVQVDVQLGLGKPAQPGVGEPGAPQQTPGPSGDASPLSTSTSCAG